MEDLIGLLASGADATIIGIGIIILRVERRISRLEYRVFGFGPDDTKANKKTSSASE